MKKQKCYTCTKKINPETDFLCPYCGGLPVFIQFIDAMAEMVQLTVKLNNKINSLRNFFKTLNLAHDDERNQFLGSISMITGWLNLQLVMYRDYSKNSDSPIPKKIKESNPAMSEVQLIEIVQNFDRMNRRSYLTSFMFLVEIFLKRIVEILPNSSNDFGYKNLVKHVLKELSMSSKDNEKFRILYFPAVARNSLHMNGIHTGGKNQGRIKGIPFVFKKDEIVHHAGWRHVYFFCDNMLDIIEKILRHDLVGDKYLRSHNPPPKTY